MPSIIACTACSTKLKMPDGSTAKALKCPKCKGVVRIPPPKEEEFEVNEAVEEQDEEFEVNEAAEDEIAEDSALAELGFAKVADVFKKAGIPKDVRETIEKAFLKKEKPLWAGRPNKQVIESKAWIGLVVGLGAMLLGLGICGLTGGLAAVSITETAPRLITAGMGLVVGGGFALVGVIAVIFRKNMGGNAAAFYVITNKRAYISDGKPGGAVRAFSAEQLARMRVVESSKFAGAGDLVFGYDFMGEQGVLASKEDVDRHGQHAGGSMPVGFLGIEDVQLVRKMVEEVLIEPSLDKKDAKKKAKEKRRYKPFG